MEQRSISGPSTSAPNRPVKKAVKPSSKAASQSGNDKGKMKAASGTCAGMTVKTKSPARPSIHEPFSFGGEPKKTSVPKRKLTVAQPEENKSIPAAKKPCVSLVGVPAGQSGFNLQQEEEVLAESTSLELLSWGITEQRDIDLCCALQAFTGGDMAMSISILSNIDEAYRSNIDDIITQFLKFKETCDKEGSDLTLNDFMYCPSEEAIYDIFELEDSDLQALPGITNTPGLGTGLNNRGFTCFMNSTLQTIFQHLDGTAHFMTTMRNPTFPSNTEERAHKSIPADIYADMKRHSVPVQTYIVFYESFMELMAALGTPDTDAGVANVLLESFQCRYRDLGIACNRQPTQDIFNVTEDTDKTLADIPQQDAHECLIDILNLLGLSRSSGFNISHANMFTLVDDERTLLTRQRSSEHASPCLSIEATQKQDDMTLQNAIDHYLLPEEMPEYTWEQKHLDRVRGPIPETAKTNKTIILKCVNNQPPARLLLHVKLFDGTTKLEEKGCDLLRVINQDIYLPVYPPTADNKIMRNPDQKRYRIKSAICHAGGVGAGHYISICKKDNQLVCFDDLSINPVGYLGEDGQIEWSNSGDLAELINERKFGGYIFSMELVDEASSTAPTSSSST